MGYFLHTVIATSLAFSLIACGETEKPPIDQESFLRIYTEILILLEYDSADTDKAYYREQVDSLLTVHGVSREEFHESLGYFQKDPVRWKEVMGKALEEIEGEVN